MLTDLEMARLSPAERFAQRTKSPLHPAVPMTETYWAYLKNGKAKIYVSSPGRFRIRMSKLTKGAKYPDFVREFEHSVLEVKPGPQTFRLSKKAE